MDAVVETSTNVVILQYLEGELLILLANNTEDPTRGWKLPSTPIMPGQTSLQSLEANLRSTIGLDHLSVTYREQLYTSESTDGAQSSLCVNYLYLCRDLRWYKGSQQVGLFPVAKLPKLPTDDLAMVRYGMDRLRAKVHYSSILAYLLPTSFTLAELQRAHETVTGNTVDRRNFRKKFTQLNVLTTAVGHKQKPGIAGLYRFKKKRTLTIFLQPFTFQ